MRYILIILVLWLGTVVIFTGCAGYDRMLFFTKTNMGLDLDTTPATVDVTISRREGVIAPTFEEGKTPPVLASFRSDVNGFSRMFTGISSSFAVGDAAQTMTELFDAPDSKADAQDSSLELEKMPVASALNPSPYQIKDDEGFIAPLIFGTDSSFGLKLAYSGMGMNFSTLRFGYNRKELAWAPISLSTKDGKPRVKVPSLLATVDNTNSIGKLSTKKRKDGKGQDERLKDEGLDIEYMQFFATGEAATNLAKKRQIREVMFKRMDPDFDPDEKGYDILVAINRDLANKLVQKTKNLDHINDPDKLTALYQASVGLGYIDSISDFKDLDKLLTDTAAANEAKDKLAKEFEDRAEEDLDSELETGRLNSLLMVLE
ncbi:MAG: hypothetical protein ACYTG7_12320 [Planctomycetota bacterium]|jgi:hypothetical protein